MRKVFSGLMISLCGFSAATADEYFPLAVGQEVTMAVVWIPSDGHKQISKGVAHRKIEATVEKNGKTYFRCHFWTEGLLSNPGLMDFTKLIRKDGKAVYVIDDLKEDAVERIDYILPLKKGARWKRVAGGHAMNSVVIAQEDVEISGKTYKNCFHVRNSYEDGEIEDLWEAPGIGVVKTEDFSAEGSRYLESIQEFKPGA